MSLLTTPLDLHQVDRDEHGCAFVICDCCKKEERSLRLKLSRENFLIAATHLGWRSMQSEHFIFDSICPSCCKELVSFYEVREVAA
ncbi:hypothetical protein [Pseudoalteromonas maricaloris]|uniref:hypothetical protein n=1 Tax=Pseudoalteromonas maricaloris TaxID=184924 RepID=UPI00029ACA13|nr:hypothetical protein [Pseudoalteromonas flavipulchra]